MTPIDPTVDTPGLWLSVSDLAKEKGVSKQAISKRVERFEASGDLTVRPGPNRSRLVNIAEFDRLAGEVFDPLRPAKSDIASAPAPKSSSNVLTDERARREGYQAEIARLDLEERLGKLLPIGEVQSAMSLCAEAFVRRVDQLHTRSEDMAAAVAKDGVAGARALFKAIAYELRDLIAKDMTLLPGDSDADDEAPRQRLT